MGAWLAWRRAGLIPLPGGRSAPEGGALDHMGERLRARREAGKPIGVLGSPRATNEENYLASRLARAGLETNHVDFCYHSLCRPLLAGVGDVTGDCSHSIHLADIESADTI